MYTATGRGLLVVLLVIGLVTALSGGGDVSPASVPAAFKSSAMHTNTGNSGSGSSGAVSSGASMPAVHHYSV